MWQRGVLVGLLCASVGCTAIVRKPSVPSVVTDVSLFAAGVLLVPVGEDSNPDAQLGQTILSLPFLALALCGGVSAMIFDELDREPTRVAPPPPVLVPLPAPLDVPPNGRVRRNSRR